MRVRASNSVFGSLQTAVCQAGMTLIELIIAIALMGIALVPLTLSFSHSTNHSADSFIEVKIVELGQAYLEEILSKRFDDNTAVGGSPACSASGTACGTIGAESGEVRNRFDDVDDYDGLIDQPPLDSLGNIRIGYERFQVEVEVDYASAAEVSAYGLDSTRDLKRILVRVSPPVGTSVEFEAYRGNF